MQSSQSQPQPTVRPQHWVLQSWVGTCDQDDAELRRRAKVARPERKHERDRVGPPFRMGDEKRSHRND